MSHPENVPSSGETFSNLDFYSRAVSALLSRARHGGDAHYLYGEVELVSEDGTRRPGTYRLSDYYAWCSNSFEYRYPEPYGGDQEEQRRLLELQDTVLNLQLYQEKRLVSPYYLLFWPYNLRPGSNIHETIYPAEDWAPPAVLPDAWPAEQPAIVRVGGVDERQVHSLLSEAGREPQLREMYRVLAQ